MFATVLGASLNLSRAKCTEHSGTSVLSPFRFHQISFALPWSPSVRIRPHRQLLKETHCTSHFGFMAPNLPCWLKPSSQLGNFFVLADVLLTAGNLPRERRAWYAAKSLSTEVEGDQARETQPQAHSVDELTRDKNPDALATPAVHLLFPRRVCFLRFPFHNASSYPNPMGRGRRQRTHRLMAWIDVLARSPGTKLRSLPTADLLTGLHRPCRQPAALWRPSRLQSHTLSLGKTTCNPCSNHLVSVRTG